MRPALAGGRPPEDSVTAVGLQLAERAPRGRQMWHGRHWDHRMACDPQRGGSFLPTCRAGAPLALFSSPQQKWTKVRPARNRLLPPVGGIMLACELKNGPTAAPSGRSLYLVTDALSKDGHGQPQVRGKGGRLPGGYPPDPPFSAGSAVCVGGPCPSGKKRANHVPAVIVPAVTVKRVHECTS